MNINTTSWHYKVWAWSYWGGMPPAKTNLCAYLRQLIFMPPLICLMFGLVAAVVIPLYICCIPLALIFGYRPAWNVEPFVQYPGLPLGRFRLYPWHVVVAFLLTYGEWAWFHHVGWVYPVVVQGGVVGLIALLFLIAYMTMEFPNTETAKLLKAWSAARTSKFCPTITFNKEPTSSIDQT